MSFLNLREELYSKSDEVKKPRKVVESFYTFLAMSDKGEKDVALVDKTEAKIIMQACNSVYCVRDYNIEI